MTDAHGGDVYKWEKGMDFSANCNPLGTPASVIRAVCESAQRLRDYPEPHCRHLSQAIAAYEHTEPGDVICSNGAAELIYQVCRAQKPSNALLAVPSFTEYEKALESVACRTVFWRRREENSFRLEESFLDYLTDRTDMVILCNPNNPDGNLSDPALMMKIVEKCRRKRIRLVVDECFLDFVKDAERHSLKRFLRDVPELFILKAFTKRYAMAGIRLGYGLSADRQLTGRMRAMSQPWSVSGPAQAAGLAALNEERHVLAGRKLVEKERDYLMDSLKELGFRPLSSAANFILFRGPEDLFEKALEEGFLIRDCSNYRGLCRGYFRIAVRLHEENRSLVEAFSRIMLRGEEGVKPWPDRS